MMCYMYTRLQVAPMQIAFIGFSHLSGLYKPTEIARNYETPPKPQARNSPRYSAAISSCEKAAEWRSALQLLFDMDSSRLHLKS